MINNENNHYRATADKYWCHINDKSPGGSLQCLDVQSEFVLSKLFCTVYLQRIDEVVKQQWLNELPRADISRPKTKCVISISIRHSHPSWTAVIKQPADVNTFLLQRLKTIHSRVKKRKWHNRMCDIFLLHSVSNGFLTPRYSENMNTHRSVTTAVL